MSAFRSRLDLQHRLAIRGRIDAVDHLAVRVDDRDVEIGGRSQRAALDVRREPLTGGQVEGEGVAIVGPRDRPVKDARDRGECGLGGGVVRFLLQRVRIGGDLEGNPGRSLIARPSQLLREDLGCRPIRGRGRLREAVGSGNAQGEGFSRPDRRGKGDPSIRESANAQHVREMIRASESRVGDLDRVPPGLLERLGEAAVEDQADIIVALGDPPALGVLDGDDRIEVLAQPAADDLECHALTGFHIDGVPVEVGRAGLSHDGCRPAQVLGRRGPGVRLPLRNDGHVVDEEQLDVAQAAPAGQAQPVNADRDASIDLHVERGPVVPARLDERGHDIFRGERSPQAGRSPQFRADQYQPSGLPPRQRGGREVLDERTGQGAGRAPPQSHHGQQTDPESLAVTHWWLDLTKHDERRGSREDRGARVIYS